MKRLALLLAAMGIISATALAEAPTLKVTNIGQELEIDNTSGGEDIGEAVSLITSVGLSYGDWTFGVAGGKFWSMDTADGIHSTDGRLQLDAWKKITDNFSLGGRYRGQDTFDRYQLNYSYANGMFWSSGEFWYQANNVDADDEFDAEWYPLGFQYGIFKAGWFLNYVTFFGEDANGMENKTEHQLRAWVNLYKSEKLSVDTEVRVTLDYDEEYKNGATRDKDGYTTFDDLGRNRVYLGATYALTENLDIYGKYGYEIMDKENSKTGKEINDGKYYGEFIVGWNYKF